MNTDDAITEIEERYRELFENTHDMVQCVSREGEFIFVNPQWTKILGYTDEDLKVLKATDVVRPCSLEQFHAVFQKVLNGASLLSVEMQFIAKDGRIVVVEGNVRPQLYDGQVVAVHGFLRDLTLLKEEQAASLEKQSRLEAILSTAVEGILTIDDRGLIESLNPAAEKLFGYSTTELAGCNIKQLMPSPYREQHDGYLANYRETGKKTIIGIGREVVGKRRDGSVFPLHLSVSEFKFADKRMFAGFVRDLSERNRTEADLQLQKQALETGATALTIADSNGNTNYVNRAFLKMWGYELNADIVGRPIADLFSSEEDYGDVLKGLREQREWIGERIAKRADGTLFEIQLSASLVTDENDMPVASMASFVDISELKSVERALRIQQRAVESATNGVLITDASQPDNPIIYVNAAMERMSGYTSKEVLGKNCRFLQGTDNEQEAVAELRTAIKEQRQCKVLLRNYRKDGTLFWNELTVSPVRSDNGILTHYVGIQSDVTERKKSEEALEQLHDELELRVEERTRQLQATQEQLVRTEKLATLGQLAGGVAHEIRNPLGVIRNAVYFLQQIPPFGDQDVTDALGEISRGLSNSERIVSELLDYARGRPSELSIFPLEEAIDAALTTVKVPKTVSIARPAPSGIHINADRGQIERLLLNLIQNAIQAMPEGGGITILCEVADACVLTKVIDTGNGIEADELEKIFEPLFTKRAKGIGLGLPLCRRYAKQNGGSLVVESEPGKGSTFTITLPISNKNGATN